VNYGERSVDISVAKPLGGTKFGFYAEYCVDQPTWISTCPRETVSSCACWNSC